MLRDIVFEDISRWLHLKWHRCRPVTSIEVFLRVAECFLPRTAGWIAAACRTWAGKRLLVLSLVFAALFAVVLSLEAVAEVDSRAREWERIELFSDCRP